MCFQEYLEHSIANDNYYTVKIVKLQYTTFLSDKVLNQSRVLDVKRSIVRDAAFLVN